MARALYALRLALAGAILLWASLFVHVFLVFGIEAGYLDGGVFPLTPSVPVTLAGLGLHCAIMGGLFVPPALLIGGLAGRRQGGVVLLALLWALIWFVGADGMAGLFAADFGTTWAAGEAFSELFFRPGLTPLAFSGGFFLFLWLAVRGSAPKA